MFSPTLLLRYILYHTTHTYTGNEAPRELAIDHKTGNQINFGKYRKTRDAKHVITTDHTTALSLGGGREYKSV